MNPEELHRLAREIVAELGKDGPLALGGASVLVGKGVATSCPCDMNCGCNAKCGCNGKEGCGCNERCPCNARTVPVKSDWVINPDPRETRVYLALDASGPIDTIVETLRNVRAGLRAQGKEDAAADGTGGAPTDPPVR